MTTKETFLSLGIADPYHETADNIDFDALDQFVTMFVAAYIIKRGHDTVKEELSADTLTETTTFLTRMIEVGSVQFLSQNGLITSDEELNNDLATVVAHGINISMATELQLNGVDDLGGNIFFGIEALYGLIARVINHINNSFQEEGYIFSLVSFNFMNFVNRDRVE